LAFVLVLRYKRCVSWGFRSGKDGAGVFFWLSLDSVRKQRWDALRWRI
jgi:hypothetical protein